MAEQALSASSPATERKGSQGPRLRVEPGERTDTFGPDACRLACECGLELFPWQRLVLDAWMARSGSAPQYTTCGLSAPRQNGKNAVLEARELYGLVVAGEHILHTAHRVRTAKKSFSRLVRYFTSKRFGLSPLVASIRYTNGEEAIHLVNGGSIEFSARSRAGNRGFDDIQLVVFDEAQDLTDDQLNAIMFTLAASASGERQMVYTGTPPDANAPGEVFTRMRAGALDDPGERTCWHEWGIAELPPKGATFASLVDAVYEANPSMGYLLDIEFTADEFRKASLDGFCHERLGWWSPAAAAVAAIPASLWADAAIEEIAGRYRKKTAFAVKFSQDGLSYALAGCKMNRFGECAVELVELGSAEGGTMPLARALLERKGKACAVAVDGLNGASALIDNMTEQKAPRGYVVAPKASAVAASAVGFLDGLRNGTVKHTTQPALDDSALWSVKRPIGTRGGWGFGPNGAHDSLAVEAAALAVWCAKSTKRNPRRKQRML